MSKRRDSEADTGSPSLLAGEGGQRRGREPGEGSPPSSASDPSPALDASPPKPMPSIGVDSKHGGRRPPGHPLPQGERAIQQANTKICVARIGAAHGVRGAVKLWTFTEDPLAVKRYGPLSTEDGVRQYEVMSAREGKGHLIAVLKGIATREQAERLNGVELYIAREKLPPTDESEYYHADLIGLAAVTAEGQPLGRVVALHNFGAGDILEIAPPHGASMLLPFSNAVVPTVDIAGGRVVIEMPGEIEGEEP